jgi:2-deoxy-D-gluconate 3-dehydrogenase
LCTRAFGAHMVAQRKGTVINIASIAGLGGESDVSAYSASKGALLAFTRSLAVEWARHHVTVNAVAPGYFRTDLNKKALDDVQVGPKIVNKIPLRRVGQPEELGPLVVYLASDAAAFMTGSVVVLDGGQLAH